MIEDYDGDDLEGVAAYTGGVPARAVEVDANNFYPRYRQGDYVIVATQGEAQAGEDVLLLLAGGRTVLYQFLYERDGHKVFQPFTRDGAPVSHANAEIMRMEPVLNIANKRAKVGALKRELAE